MLTGSNNVLINATDNDLHNRLHILAEHAHCWPHLQFLDLTGAKYQCSSHLHVGYAGCRLESTDAPALAACLRCFPNLLQLSISCLKLFSWHWWLATNDCLHAGNRLEDGLVEVLESLRHTLHIQSLNVEG